MKVSNNQTRRKEEEDERCNTDLKPETEKMMMCSRKD